MRRTVSNTPEYYSLAGKLMAYAGTITQTEEHTITVLPTGISHTLSTTLVHLNGADAFRLHTDVRTLAALIALALLTITLSSLTLGQLTSGFVIYLSHDVPSLINEWSANARVCKGHCHAGDTLQRCNPAVT